MPIRYWCQIILQEFRRPKRRFNNMDNTLQSEGQAWKMKGDMPYFRLAKCGSWCHTKDFIRVSLPPGVNYLEFLNRKQTVPKVQLETPNTGNAALETAARIEGELQLLHTRPDLLPCNNDRCYLCPCRQVRRAVEADKRVHVADAGRQKLAFATIHAPVR